MPVVHNFRAFGACRPVLRAKSRFWCPDGLQGYSGRGQRAKVPARSVALPANGVLSADAVFHFAVSGAQTVAVTQLAMADLNSGIVPFASAEIPVLMTVTAVPEPETWRMLLAGMGLLGAVARRRVARA